MFVMHISHPVHKYSSCLERRIQPRLANCAVFEYSLVLYIPELLGPCDHVHILPAVNYHWQGHEEEGKVSLVGQIPDAVSDVSVCHNDDPSRIHLAGVTIPQISVRLAVCVHDILAGALCKLLQKKTRKQVTHDT